MLERLRSDWPLKLVALLLAFGVWVSITGQGRTLKDFTVPLEIDFGDERIATNPPPTTVTVRLEGTRTSIRQLDQDQLALAVRLDMRLRLLAEACARLRRPSYDRDKERREAYMQILDLWSERPEIVERLLPLLLTKMASVQPRSVKPVHRVLSEDEQEMLRELGYVE